MFIWTKGQEEWVTILILTLMGLTLVMAAPGDKTDKTTSRPHDPPSGRKRLLTRAQVVEFCKIKNATGNFSHPVDTTCTRYVGCYLKIGVFKEKSCPEGHLYFDPVSAKCQTEMNKTPCAPVRPTTTTDAVDFDTNVSEFVTSTSTPTSDEGGYTMTPLTLTLTSLPKKCSPQNYVQHGYCKTYFTCDRKTSLEKEGICSGRLYWNPDVNSIHGGVCDYLKNIDNSTLFQYKKDPGCSLNLAYFRRSEGECSSHYFYHHPTRTNGTEVKLTCPEDLLWSKEHQTCVLCHQIKKLDGHTPCCPLERETP